jgi:hypothetical protein
MALDRLKEQPLASTSDNTVVAKWLTRNYDQQRDYLLQNTYLWKFALDRASLPADSTAPPWGWENRYALPTDCLRIIPPTIDGAWDGTPVSFEEESGYLLSNATAPLRLRYVKRVTNEGYFSNGFCEVLALRLAFLMAHWVTGKQSMMTGLGNAYEQTLRDVKEASAFQVAQDSYYDDQILAERSSYP